MGSLYEWMSDPGPTFIDHTGSSLAAGKSPSGLLGALQAAGQRQRTLCIESNEFNLSSVHDYQLALVGSANCANYPISLTTTSGVF